MQLCQDGAAVADDAGLRGDVLVQLCCDPIDPDDLPGRMQPASPQLGLAHLRASHQEHVSVVDEVVGGWQAQGGAHREGV